jgi:hypothetical protein
MFNIFSVHVISLIVAGLAVVAVFVYIPFVSDYAFWFLVAAYVMLAGHRWMKGSELLPANCGYIEPFPQSHGRGRPPLAMT